MHMGKEGPSLKAARAAIRPLKGDEWLMVNPALGAKIEAELRAITGDNLRGFGIEIFEIAGHRIISSPFVPEGGMFAVSPESIMPISMKARP